MDKLTQTAISYLEQDQALYIGMLEPIRKGTADIICVSDRGILLLEEQSGAYMLAADTPEQGALLLRQISACDLLVVYGEAVLEEAKLKFPSLRVMPCYQAVYLKKQKLPGTSVLDIRLSRPEDLAVVKETYGMLSPEEIEQVHMQGNLYCGFSRQEMVGFIGLHAEGSMGMLEILPAHRRKGYGEALERFLINRLLEQGRTPFAQVVEGNHASLRLQKKLGLTIAEHKIYWLY